MAVRQGRAGEGFRRREPLRGHPDQQGRERSTIHGVPHRLWPRTGAAKGKTSCYPIQMRKVTDNFFCVAGVTLAQGQTFTATVPSHQIPSVMGAGLVGDRPYGLGSVITNDSWMEGTLVVVGVLSRTGDVRPLGACVGN